MVKIPKTEEEKGYLSLNPKDICKKIKLNIPAKNQPFLKKKFMDTIEKLKCNSLLESISNPKYENEKSEEASDEAENMNSEQAKADKKKKLN